MSTSSGLHVPTRSIQSAVKGQELDVLSSLGIKWNLNGSHISCPYPGHEDKNPSWRWDEKKAKARCTCIERSHSVFDVVMQIEGIDFAAAKLRVVEIIDRRDLIKAKGSKRFQAMDAASLLRPADDQRVGGLVEKYLGFRLDVSPDQIVMPSTPATAWRSLAYYDPPAAKKGKPVCVGHFPCLIFGTLAPDGRSHAHRIYVAIDGQGKAELGVRDDGRSRDAKKAAKRPDGENTSGCAVVWGDPGSAPHLILAESIETAAALAYAHKLEIEETRLAIAAALSTSGIRSFSPWPATRLITLAADRDEDMPRDDRGFKAGERAARDFALRHHEDFEIRISLPGNPGESVDWLDVLRSDGVAALRDETKAATQSEATPEELEKEKQRAAGEAELVQIERLYPLPAMKTMTLDYRRTRSGRILIHKYIGADEDGVSQCIPVATPIGVPARLRYADRHDTYGLRAVIQDMNGDPAPIDFDRATLARMGASDIRANLFSAGLRVESDGEAVAVQLLKAADPLAEIRVVSEARLAQAVWLG